MLPDQAEQPKFQFDGFFFRRISLETLSRQPLADGETLQPGITLDVRPVGNIEIDHDQRRAEVLLGFRLTPDPKKQAYVIIVEIVGAFSLQAGTIDQLTQFAKGGASSILFPYVRQMISTITRDGKWGPVLLHPINVQTIFTWQENVEGQTSIASSEPSPPLSQLPSDEQESKN